MIRAAIAWRLRILNQVFLRLRWYLRRLLDFSAKETVDKISIVVVGRNDNYGGDFSHRLQTVLDWNLAQLPNAELIYIEWNAISSRPSDCEWITKRYLNSFCYIVPKSIHDSITNNPKMPVMEYFAKNLGIRKSKSQWILMLNADVFIGSDTVKRIQMLNKKTVYGTHYVSIKWDGKALNEGHQTNKDIIVTKFAAPENLSATVGNFILTHKDNWMLATGYDERLNNVRAGVDTNGLEQLLYIGLKPIVLGNHYHLDHPESIIHGSNDTHGKHAFDNIPYKNKNNWGFIDHREIQIAERIWELQPI